MFTLYFCFDGIEPMMRYWSGVPRIGETLALPELGGSLNPLKVYDVVWEGTVEPTVSVFVHRFTVDHSGGNDAPHSSNRNMSFARQDSNEHM